MTNLFANNEEEIKHYLSQMNQDESIINEKILQPVPVNITNVAQWWVKQKGYLDDFMTHDFPWKHTWYEYTLNKKDGNVVIGVLVTIQGERVIYLCTKETVSGLMVLGLIIYDINRESYEYVTNPYEPILQNFDVSRVMMNCIAPINLSNTFANSTKVNFIEVGQSEKLKKANKKRGKIPQKTYRVLDLDGVTKNVAKKSLSEKDDDIKRSLHICRGHFKKYTEDNPLFGKHTGTFWIPMHLKGSEKEGVSNKEYKINPGKDSNS